VLNPQHLTFPPDVSAQVLSPPAEIFSMLLSELASLEDVRTLIVGDSELLFEVPFPSCP